MHESPVATSSLASFREESPDRLIDGHREIHADDDRIDWGRLSDQDS